jgi:hypothetical protein
MTKNDLKQLIKEVAGDSWKFTTPLKKNYVEILRDRVKYPEHDIEAGEAVIIWEADIEARSWGIKNISPSIISGRVSYTINDIETMKPVEEKEIEWTLTDTKGYKIEIGQRSEGSQLVPTGITVDEQSKTITVNF